MKTRYFYLLIFSVLVACSSDQSEADAFGNFEATETIISVESPGKIIEMKVQQGDQLASGDLIALTDTSQLYFGMEQLRAQIDATLVKRTNVNAQVDVLNEQLRNLKTDQDRVSKLFRDGAATQKELDFVDGKVREIQKQIVSVKTQFTMIDREVEVLNTKMAQTLDLMLKCRVMSPVEGTVLEKYLEQGEVAAMGKPLVKVANLDVLDLKVYVSGDQLSQVLIGHEVGVMIDDATENSSLKGIVKWISPEAEFTPKIIQTKAERVKLVYAVKISVKNDGRLKIGMPGEIRFNQ